MAPTSGQFYHGTSLEAALAIQSTGFRVDLSGTNAGAMLGDGVYITTTLEKALNYAKVKPHSGAIFKLQVKLGKCKKVGKNDPMMRTWHAHGYDSYLLGRERAIKLNGNCWARQYEFWWWSNIVSIRRDWPHREQLIELYGVLPWLGHSSREIRGK